MTMLRSLAFSVLAAVLLIAAPARADDVRAAIDAANAKMMADYAAGDTKALALAYTEDAVMLPPDATRVVGHAAIEALWKSWIDAGLANLTLKSTDVDSGGDLAYEIGEFTLQVPVKGGNPTTATGNYVVVWKRGEDGAWRLKIDTWNDTPSPTEAQSTSGG
jgi:uncharacterized protein (TIGR02246 family)